jgi:propionate CoA-transferase
MSKVIALDKIAGVIKDGSAISVTTAGLVGFPEAVAEAIEKSFLGTGHPRDLTLMHSCGCGDGKDRGANRFGYEGMIKRLIAGHTGESPKLGKLMQENKIEAYLLPQGVMAHMWRHIAGKKMGVITKVGLRTFVDPRQTGGKVNDVTKEDLVKLLEIEGEEWLLYKNFPVDVAIIRGTYADEKGNVTFGKEPLFLEAISMAQAAKNNGGIVIAQVLDVVKNGTLNAQEVKVPGDYVDFIVKSPPEKHPQTKGTIYNPALSGEVKIPLNSLPPMELGARKIIARRAAVELKPNSIVNLGIGMPDGVANVASEEGVIEKISLTVELGTYGGMPASGLDFATAYNPEAIIDHQFQFDFYDGGGIDTAFLGASQIDQFGNVNVSKFGDRIVGPGGFINISQNSKEVIFCGTFTAGGFDAEVKDGELRIIKEGKIKKFVENVDHITYSGEFGSKTKQSVIFVTERAVFKLREEGGLELIEIAPGVDLKKDILGQMEFEPHISEDLKTMSSDMFNEKWNKLKI